MRPALGLLLLALLVAWPTLFTPGWQGTEGRRVQIALEMARSGDLLVPTLGHETTLAKPPVYYWSLVPVVEAGRDTLWPIRLVSMLSLWAVALASFLLHDRRGDRVAAWIAGAGVLCAPALVAKIARAEIDPMFAAWTALSLLLLAEGAAARVRSGGGRWLLLGAGLVGGVALLTKGPPYFLFLAGALLVWARRLRLAGCLYFVVPLLLTPVAYYGPLIGLRVDLDTMLAVAGEESTGRVLTFNLDHVLATPGYVLRAAAVLLPLGLWTFHEWRYRRLRPATVTPGEAALRMCAGATFGAVALLLFFPGRPTRYLLPVIPLFVYAVAPAVASYWRSATPPVHVWRTILLPLGVLAVLGLLAAPFLPSPLPGRLPWLLGGIALVVPMVHARRDVVLVALGLPVLAAWTVLHDVEEYRTQGSRAPRPAARLLAEGLERHGVATGDLETRGHFESPVLLALDRLPQADEFLRRAPQAPWVLVEDPDRVVSKDASEADAYRDVLRVRVRHKSLVLRERRR